MKAKCKPEANLEAVAYRSCMILELNQFVQEQLAPWVQNEQVSAAVFRVMATIPMERLGPTVREGLPFDVERFFRRLKEGGVQNLTHSQSTDYHGAPFIRIHCRC